MTYVGLNTGISFLYTYYIVCLVCIYLKRTCAVLIYVQLSSMYLYTYMGWIYIIRHTHTIIYNIL